MSELIDTKTEPNVSPPASAKDRERLQRVLAQARLPSLPLVLIRIYDALESDTAGVDHIARLLETDTGLTARALQLGNSAFYKGQRQLSRVKDVLIRIGPFELWWLLLATEVKTLFFGIDHSLMDMERFWHHSLYVACASSALSDRCRLGSPQDMFVAGLLHDVGKLLLLRQLPVEYAEVLRLQAEGRPLLDAEMERMGFDHATAGAELLRRWRLPGRLTTQVAEHHVRNVELSKHSLVWAADRLAHHALEGEALPDLHNLPTTELLAQSNQTYERLVRLIL